MHSKEYIGITSTRFPDRLLNEWSSTFHGKCKQLHHTPRSESGCDGHVVFHSFIHLAKTLFPGVHEHEDVVRAHTKHKEQHLHTHAAMKMYTNETLVQ